MFNSILGEELTILHFLACLGTAFVLGLLVALLHKKTAKSNMNFITTLAILPVLVAVVILLVNGNVGTGVAVAGAFSLVRFRSLPGNSREIMNVFFSMAIGLAVGTGYLAFAAIFTAIVCIISFILYQLHFGETSSSEKILKILVPEDLDYTNVFDKEFDKYLADYTLIKSKTTNMGSLYELTYKAQVKNNINEKEFIDKLRIKNGNLKIILSHPLVGEEL